MSYKPKFKFDAKDTAFLVDPEHHMMLGMNYNWNPTGDRGKGDAIGRTFEAYYVYRDERFVEAVKNCWEMVPTLDKNGIIKDYYYQGYRYPTHEDNDMSRDHTLYTVLLALESGISEEELKEFVTHIPWKISQRFSMTPDLWLWFRARAGVWWAKILSNMIDIPLLAFYVVWQKIIYKLAPFREESHQDDFVKINNDEKDPKWSKWALKLYPPYAIAQSAWKINYLKPSLAKSIQEWLLLKITPKHNYVVRMLLNDKNMPSREDVYGFKAMMGGRWSAILNPFINDRDLHIMTKENYPKLDTLLKANNLEVDLVRVIYENKTK